MYPNLNSIISDDQQFRLDKINEIRYYFLAEIKERELMSKRRSKYIAFFYHFDKSLIISLVITGSISILSFAIVIGAPAGIINACFGLACIIHQIHHRRYQILSHYWSRYMINFFLNLYQYIFQILFFLVHIYILLKAFEDNTFHLRQ